MLRNYEKWKKNASSRLARFAACRNASPVLFDQTEVGTDFTNEALAFCKICKVQEECLLIVDPEGSYFDGIAGGMVFFNGKLQTKQRKIRKR